MARRTDRSKDHSWEHLNNNNQHRCKKCKCIRTRLKNNTFTFQKDSSDIITQYIECETNNKIK